MRATRARGGPQSALRRGYWMQFWAALYALGQVYPNPRLTVFVALVVVVLAVLVVDTAPVEWGKGR